MRTLIRHTPIIGRLPWDLTWHDVFREVIDLEPGLLVVSATICVTNDTHKGQGLIKGRNNGFVSIWGGLEGYQEDETRQIAIRGGPNVDGFRHHERMMIVGMVPIMAPERTTLHIALRAGRKPNANRGLDFTAHWHSVDRGSLHVAILP